MECSMYKYLPNNEMVIFFIIKKKKKYLIDVLDCDNVQSILFPTQQNLEMGTGLNFSSDGSLNFVHWHLISVEESVSISSNEFLEKLHNQIITTW